MTVASYTTDLTDMDLAASETGWAEATATGWTSVFAVTGGETDDYIQNTTCNSTTVKTGVGALLFDEGTGITLSADHAVLVWIKWDVYPSLDTEANGGIRTVMGDALNSFYAFKHLGSDSYIYDGWTNLATGDPDDADITPDYTVGGITSGFTNQFHGWAFNALSVPSKGNPYKVDAIRYGRCEIRCINGDATRYGRFDDMAQENDYNDVTNGYNRWGLFQQITPSNYLWKGLMSIGTATVTDFRDTNRSITVANTKHVTPDFNKIEINNAASNVDWTGISIAALGTVSKGNLEVIDNANFDMDACTFTDMGTFIFLSNTTALGTTFRRCGQITQGGATVTGCLIENSTSVSSMVVSNLAVVTGNTFVSDGANHAVDLGAITGNTTVSWNNDLTGYVTGSTGDPVTEDDTTNAAILCNVSDTFKLTINVSTGASVPSIKNIGLGTVAVNSSVDLSVTVVDSANVAITGSQVRIEETDGTTVAEGAANTGAGSNIFTGSFSGATPLNVIIKVRKSSTGSTRYIPVRTAGQITSSGLTTTVSMATDPIVSA